MPRSTPCPAASRRTWCVRWPARLPRGGYSILYGDLAPEGSIVKLAGHGRHTFEGPARVFDSEEAAFAAVQDRQITAGDVVVIRFEGPAGDLACARCWR